MRRHDIAPRCHPHAGWVFTTPDRAPDARPGTQKPLIVVLGDSVSKGDGMAYDDIYRVRL